MNNAVMMQFFEWNIKNDGQHWKRLQREADHLTQLGVAAVWIPPCTKGSQQNSTGYDIYDLYDLGEFDQKGSVRTKYGDKESLISAIQTLHTHGIQVYGDVVLNHKSGADEAELFQAIEVDPNDREKEMGPPLEVQGWTKFYFSGRGGKYSDFQWNYTHFSAVDRDELSKKNAIFKIAGEGKVWSRHVDNEKQNFDYLMSADIDYHNGYVVEEVHRWGVWFLRELALDGFRMDALKHIDEMFMRNFIDHMRMEAGTDFPIIGEYWHGDVQKLNGYLERMGHALQLFDVALHFRFHEASHRGRDFDLSKILADTLVTVAPFHAVTFVDNHDSQPGQALASWVEDWFKPIAYALILLRQDGYPCVFYGDYEGVEGENPIAGKKDILDKLLLARKLYAYGEQEDYFDHPNVIGFTRKGDGEHPDSGIAVLISNGEDGEKRMCLGVGHAGRELKDLMGVRKESVRLDDQGFGTFFVAGGSVSVWGFSQA